MLPLLMVLMVLGIGSRSAALSQGAASADALAGKWKTTVVPEKGEAPMIAPEMAIEAKGGTVMVTMGTKASPVTATAFDGGKAAGTYLILKMSKSASGMATVIVRPVEAGRVRVEYFFEYPSNARSKNFYYAEVFARAK